MQDTTQERPAVESDSNIPHNASLSASTKRKRIEDGDSDDAVYRDTPNTVVGHSLSGDDSRKPEQAPTPSPTLVEPGNYEPAERASPHDNAPVTDEVDSGKIEAIGKEEGELQEFRNPNDDNCTIVVADRTGTATPFNVAKVNIGESSILADLLRFEESRGSHIDLPKELSVSALAFMPVATYLQTGDFGFKIIEEGRSLPRLAGVATQAERDDAAQQIAMIYATGSTLRLADLQMLAVDKIRLVYPLSPLFIMIVARIVLSTRWWGCDAEQELQEWIADHITEYFWELMAKHGKWLGRALRANEDLKRHVLDKIQDDPEAGGRGFDEDDEGTGN